MKSGEKHNEYILNKKSKIINIFGASVTQQKDGYATILKNKLFTDHEINIFSFGGCHLSDAGIVRIGDVLENNPDVAIIDWFSTALRSIDNEVVLNYYGNNNIKKNFFTISHEKVKEYMDTLINKFHKNNCKLVFLFLVRSDHLIRIEFYNYLKKYLDNKKIFYIDLNDKLKYNELIIKDVVHTTKFGSEIYANFIYEKLNSKLDSLSIPTEIPVPFYGNIKKIDFNKEITEYIEFTGNGTIFTMSVKIGPFSGLIQYNDEKINSWDVYCHFERNFHFPSLKTFEVNNNLKLSVLQEDFDTSICRREFDFKANKKKNENK
jgi:hypothetical protein